MKPLWRDVLIVVAALLLGGGGCLLLGASPAAVVPTALAEPEWVAPSIRSPDLAAEDAVWEARAPWGAVPKPVEAPPPPPPPPPVPVGIVRGAHGAEAIFLIHGSGELRIRIGGQLPDGGRLLGISGMQVAWVDGEGQRHRRRLFLDPMQPSGADQPP
ncbi:hypothetical protein [Pseudoxanthomonas mexicana]|uniref:hypothetical protein n=1 Tax=Pseudoxanthomonas mexicana TaxID=128785 RepID=UPI00398A8E9D